MNQNNRRRNKTEKSSSAFGVQQQKRTSAHISDGQNIKLNASSMTRISSFKYHPLSKTTPAASNAATSNANPTAAHSSSSRTVNLPACSFSSHTARLAVLSSANLNALFRTNKSIMGTSLLSSFHPRPPPLPTLRVVPLT